MPTAPPPTTGTTPATTTTTPMPAPATAVASGPPILGIAGGVAAGLGVVGAAAGGVFYALGAGTHGALQTTLNTPDTNGVVGVTRADAEARSLAGTNEKTTGVVLLGVGGALVVGGGALLTMQLLGGE